MSTVLTPPDEAIDAEVAASIASGRSVDGRGLAFQAALLLALFLALAVLVWLLYSVVDGALPVFQERSVGDFLSGKLSGSPARFGPSGETPAPATWQCVQASCRSWNRTAPRWQLCGRMLPPAKPLMPAA